MNSSLLRTLIEKKFFTTGIEVDATYMGRDLSGSNLVTSHATFTVLGMRLIGVDEVALEGANVIDGSRRIFYGRSLINIAGMCPIRFAASCGIDENGEKIQEGKRRGRKPKNRAVIVEEIVQAFDDDDMELDDDEVFEAA